MKLLPVVFNYDGVDYMVGDKITYSEYGDIRTGIIWSFEIKKEYIVLWLTFNKDGLFEDGSIGHFYINFDEKSNIDNKVIIKHYNEKENENV